MPTTNYGMAKMFDGVTLAVSLLLLLGIVRPNVLILLGNLKPFLITAGGGGLVYSLHSLFAPP